MLIHETTISGQYPVTLRKTGRGRNASFTVVYGSEITGPLNYEQAAREYGLCIFHALQCAGLLDEEQP